MQQLFSFSSPDLKVYTGILTLSECDAVIFLAKNRLSASQTIDVDTGRQIFHPERVCLSMNFNKHENDFISSLEDKIAAIVGVEVDRLENIQVLKYNEGGKYSPHYDFFNPEKSGTPRLLVRGGQRVATFIIYLNSLDPTSGGDTCFPRIGLKINPIAGNGLFFKYADLDKATLHGASPVNSGEKWVVVTWVRESLFK